jgi:hypothetical protein
MNVNKKLDRFKQWAGEKMGGEVKTGVSDEFKSLEMEMDLRHQGMLHALTTFTCNTNTIRRHGEDATVDDNLRQVSVEACRG